MWQSFSLLARRPFILRLLLKTQCAPRQRNPHRSAHQRNEKKKMGMIWITYMIPHATKSGKRHRKFFCTIDVPSIQRHIRIVQQGPLRVQAQVFVRAKAGVLSPKQCPSLQRSRHVGGTGLFNLSNPSALLVTSHRDNVQIHAVEKSLDRLPRFCYTINRSY